MTFQTIIDKFVNNIHYAFSFLFFLLAIFSRKYGKRFIEKLTRIFYKDNILSEYEKNILDIVNAGTNILSLFFLDISITFLNLPRKFLFVKDKIFFFLYLYLFYKLSFKFIDLIFLSIKQKKEKELEDDDQKAILSTYLELIRKGVKILVLIIFAFSICRHFGLDVSTLIASLGIGSLAVGLATQDTIKNFISGLIIVSDKPFRLGDYIRILGDNIEGHVVDIGIRSTKILTLDNNIIIVPNSTLTEKSIENLHYPNPLIKGRVQVGVAYSSDIKLVKKVIFEAISETENILDIPKPSINLINFGDSSLDFLVLFYVKRRDLLWDTQNLLREKILEKFRKYNIEIPFPQQDIWFRNELKISKEDKTKNEVKNA